MPDPANNLADRFDVTVIMPCYNAAQWIGLALDSIAKQDLMPTHLIITDDGSTDDSINLIQQHPLNQKIQIQIVQTQRLGGAGARNAAAEHAQTNWLAFLDADDLWYPQHLAQAAALFSKNDFNDVGYMEHRDIVDVAGQIEKRPVPWGESQPTADLSDADYLTRFAKHEYFAMSSVIVRRDRFEAVGGFDAQQIRRHDIDLWLRIIHEHTWAFHTKPGTAYRIDTPGAISRHIADRERWFLKAMLKNAELYERPETQPAMTTAIRSAIHRAARRAMSAALTDGTSDDVKQTWPLAEPYLTEKDQRLFKWAKVCPAAFRAINKLRRRVG